MKKARILLLSALCIIAFSACGSKEASDSAISLSASSQTEETPESFNSEASTDTDEDMGEVIESEDLEEIVSEASTAIESTISDIQEDDTAVSESAESSESTPGEELVDGMRPEFKEAMDSYEAFYDEYCDFLNRYSENPSDLKLLADYADMLTKADEMSEKFEAWEDSDLNNAELEYYLDVNNRVAKKLLEVSE